MDWNVCYACKIEIVYEIHCNECGLYYCKSCKNPR